MWFVYVIFCGDGSLYTGISDDPQRRFQEHLAGKGGRYTRSHKPVRFVYKEQVKDKREALRREMEIKSWSRREKMEILDLKI